jgi:type II secretory pathway component GspD/PulD (secretin)
MAAYTEKVKKTVAERIMRLLFVTVVVLAPCLVRAQNITINVTDRPLSEVFQAIKKASGYQVFYVNQNVDDSRKVSFNVSGVELRAALDKLCASVALSYNIVDRTIVISPPPPENRPGVRSSAGRIRNHGNGIRREQESGRLCFGRAERCRAQRCFDR